MTELPVVKGHLSYKASETRRFDLSLDPISQGRLRVVEAVDRDLHSLLPFYRATTLKGSLSKGKPLTDANAATTDIDLGSVVDVTAIAALSDDRLEQICASQGIPANNNPEPVQPADGNNNIFPSSELTPSLLAKLRRVQRATEKLIARTTDDHSLQLGVATPVIEPIVFFIAEEGPFSIYSTLLEYENPRANWPTRGEATRALALPFGMRLGDDGLLPYRKAFFSELQKLDMKVAEQKWQTVLKAIYKNERQDNIPQSIAHEFPQTLEEAIAMYS